LKDSREEGILFMNREKQIRQLNALLLGEMPEYEDFSKSLPQDTDSQRRLLRSLMNLRPPLPLGEAFLTIQDELLSAEREEKGIVEGMALPAAAAYPQIVLWQGDITRLRVDAIVNAANSALLGCFHPCHGCIDNAIHSAAGLQLREECRRIIERQGHPEPAGQAKLTGGYNLPARYVLHTVGPIVQGAVTGSDRKELAACYRSCLKLAAQQHLESVAFCCISTGEFHFPQREAAEIALHTVAGFLRQSTSVSRVIFNVFKDRDAEIYRELLGEVKASAKGAG
jgi:O-acetyl-ADP-ribose deacetylase (regulator of RNase III)